MYNDLPYVLAVDPGNTQSGWVYFTVTPGSEYGLELQEFGIDKNSDLRQFMRSSKFDVKQTRLVIETPRPRGMPTAGEEMETLIMIGRFIQEWSRCGGRWTYVFRGDVKLHLTGSPRAKDPHVRQAILDRFGGDQRPVKCPTCKGKGWVGVGRPACTTCDGEKLQRLAGPLHGISSHMFAALAAGLWWLDGGELHQQIINPGGRDPRAAQKQAQPPVQTRPSRKVLKKRTSKTLT